MRIYIEINLCDVFTLAGPRAWINYDIKFPYRDLISLDWEANGILCFIGTNNDSNGYLHRISLSTYNSQINSFHE